MLKLPKGLKKKKKDKKSKKNQELFTEEELEQFKREQKAKQLAEEEEEAQRAVKPKPEDDEWSKFNQLTTGIDTVLKKTQGDLDRIKESSFFQRVAPPKPKRADPKQKKVADENQEKEEDGEQGDKEGAGAAASTSHKEETEEETRARTLSEAVIELSESEEESDDGDDIFDTNYIDTLTSGNVPLAYVPDSPDEVDEGPDPFDTAYADKIIKGPEVSKRGKKIVNIGSAVEVLTGRVEKVNAKALKRPRRGIQNLLLESFDKDAEENTSDTATAANIESVSATETVVHNLLDDPADELPDIPIDLSVSLHLQFQPLKEEKTAEQILEDFEKDEFDDLAAESLIKKDEVIVVQEIVSEPVLIESTEWSAFEGEPHPADIIEVDDLDDEIGDDPFDTAYVETVIKEKSFDDDDFDFDPRADEKSTVEKAPVIVAHIPEPVQLPDLLSGSTNDLSDLSHVPVITATDSIDIEKEFDPFDTSAISSIVQPKETEIKFLEKELLTESFLKHSLSDPDFDPRSDEKLAPTQTTAERKSSLSLNIAGVSHKTVGFSITNLSVTNGSENKIQKPLTPYYSGKSIEEAIDVNDDDLSDSEFNPRAESQNQPKPDLLAVSIAHDIKVLTPSTEFGQNTAPADPFDTSNFSEVLVPGKTELKLLESELITATAPVHTAVLDTNSDSQELGLGDKVLTPHVCLSAQESLEEIDPFDTSFASNIAPGQAEIKVIESELIHK